MNIPLKDKQILLAPLDWGLGHTTRCIPLLRYLLANNNKVIIACNETQKTILSTEFKCINFTHLEGYEIAYAKRKRLLPLKLLWQLPRLWLKIRYEHNWLNKIIATEKIDVVISDNRYGLYTTEAHCIFMTHQLEIQVPFPLIRLIQRLNYFYIEKFHACWVPDDATKPGLAGKLSHPEQMPKIPVTYLGSLSRLKPIQKKNTVYKWLISISGPEPQRTLFEKKLIAWMFTHQDSCVLVRGKPGSTDDISDSLPPHCTFYNHISTSQLEDLLSVSAYVICRSGYTSIMEMFTAGISCILVPTPGQTEQEYLAQHLMEQKKCYSFSQDANFVCSLQRAELFFVSNDQH